MTVRSSQSGNIFFYIFLGITLFGALGYAISRSSVNTNAISDEKARLIATELIAQGSTVKDAVTRIQLKGYKRSEVSFVNSVMTSTLYNNSRCTTNDCKVFQVEGGNISYPIPPPEATVSSNIYWGFDYNNTVMDVDYADNGGFRSGMLMYLHGVNPKVCRYINNILHGLSLNTDLAGRPGFTMGGYAPWNGTLLAGPGGLNASHFLPLTSTKSMFCMPSTMAAPLTNTINFAGTSTTTSVPTYSFYTNLSPSR